MIDFDTSPRRRIHNPGRRGLNAEGYRFPLRMPLESLFRDSVEYRILRWEFDAAERKLTLLTATRAPSSRLLRAQARITAASAKCAEFMLRNLPAQEPTGPTVLTRELDADGMLVSEVETPVESAP